MKKLFLTSILIVSFSLPYLAQPGYQPSEDNLKNREWFREAKFGMFLHWGVYSVMAGGGDLGEIC